MLASMLCVRIHEKTNTFSSPPFARNAAKVTPELKE